MTRRFTVYAYRRDAKLAAARAEAARANRKAIIAENAMAFLAGLCIIAACIFAYAAGITWDSFR